MPESALAHAPVSQVGAVIVSFHPDADALARMLAALEPQVHAVFIVDNGSGPLSVQQLEVLAASYSKVQLVLLPENRGIAAAHNAGLRCAIERGLAHAILFDQDTLASPDLVATLVAAHDGLVRTGARVAAVGPRWLDERSGRTGEFYRISCGRIVAAPVQGDAPVDVDFLISSGTLVPLAAVEAIGFMREDLFIDHVDTEWCVRAKAAGWKLFGVPAAGIRHALGDDRQRVWLGRWREVALHSPERNYYEVRNTLLLLRTPGITWSWRFAQWSRLAQILVFYAFLVEPKPRRIRLMARGLRDGLAGRGGKLV